MDSSPRKVHHSYIWLGGLKNACIVLFAIMVSLVGSVVPMLIKEIDDGFEFTSLYFLIGVLIIIAAVVLIAGIIVLIYWLSWKYMSYELAPQQFNFYSGIFSKKRLHIPYQRVQSVDMRAGVLQRIAGVCTLEIDTAGGSSNKAVLVPYVLKSDAQAVRAEIFGRKHIINNGGIIREDGSAVMPDGTVITSISGSFFSATQENVAFDAGVAAQGAYSSAMPNGAQNAENVFDDVNEFLVTTHGAFDNASFNETAAVRFETGLTNKELLLSGISDVKNVAAAIFVALVGILGFLCSFGVAVDFFAEQVEEQIESGAFTSFISNLGSPLFVLQLILPGVLAFFGAYVVMAAFSAIGSVLSYGGFKVRRRGNRVEVERGLLQRQTQGVDIDRVQLVRVEHGWIRRMFGYCKVMVGRIDSAAKDDSGKNSQTQAAASQGMVVHPFLKTSELEHFLHELMPEFDCECENVVKPPQRAKRRAVLRGALWFNGGFWTLVGLLICALFIYVCVAAFEPDYAHQTAHMLLDFWSIAVVLLIPMAIGVVRGLKWLKGSYLAYGGNFVKMVNEGFTCKEVIIPRQKIQFSNVRMNPFQYAQDFRNVEITTATGIGGIGEMIWDLELEDAETVQEWLRPRR